MQRQVPAGLYWRCPRSSSSTVVGSPVACSTCTHSANCAETVKFSRCRSWTGCLHPVIVQRGAQFGLAGRRHPCRGAHADSYGPSIQKVIEILLLQYIDKVIDVGCRSCSSRSIRGGDSRAPTVAPIAWTVVAMPLVVQRQLLWSRRQKTAQVPQLQYVFVVDGVHSWTRLLTCPLLSTTWLLTTVEVPQIQFIACRGGHSSCAADGYDASSIFLYGGDEGFFLTLFASFFALLRLSRS